MAGRKKVTDEVVEEIEEVVTETKETNTSDDTMKAMLDTIKSLQKEIETLKAEKQNISLNVTNKDMETKRVIPQSVLDEMNRMNEKVLFQPMYDGATYKDDIFVSINGKAYVINRKKAYEKPVQIPRCVYEIIKESEKNLLNLNVMKSGLSKTYNDSIEKLN